MEKQAGSLLLTVLLSAALISALSSEKPRTVGEELKLKPPVSGPFTNVLWKHNGNLVAEWTKQGDDLDLFGSFKGRTTLDTTTGSLTINNVQVADSGEYTVEVNNTVQDQRFNVQVIKELGKPTIWTRPVACSPDSDSCTLTCDTLTEGAEPVTYSWRRDDGAWTESEKNLIITKAEDAEVETFTCRVKNPVSEGESERLKNPIYPKSKTGKIVGGVCGGLIGLVAVAGAIWKREAIKKRLCGEKYDPTATNENELTPNASAPPIADEPTKPQTGESPDPENGSATGNT